MEQPEGYDYKSNRVCQLDKALYGLRQTPLQWNKRISAVLEDLALDACQQDPCVYVRECDDRFLALYVDDGLCAAPPMEVVCQLLDALQKTFKMTRGDANCFLGLEIVCERKRKNTEDSSVSISQESGGAILDERL